jgi:hypothetical protein
MRQYDDDLDQYRHRVLLYWPTVESELLGGLSTINGQSILTITSSDIRNSGAVHQRQLEDVPEEIALPRSWASSTTAGKD